MKDRNCLIEKNPLIYLNNAATSWPKPPEVLQAIQESLTYPFSGGRRGSGSAQVDYLSSGREIVSDFFGVDDPDTIIFSSNATDALNTLIQGFVGSQNEPFHTITTNLEHNSVLRPLYHIEQTAQISLDYVPFKNNMVDPESIIEAVKDKTRLVVMTHGSNVVGSVQDIRAVGEYLYDKGIFFIVDGSQTAGHIPLNLSSINLDAYVFTGHKGLYGIPGIGGFYIRTPEKVVPVRMGGTGTDSGSLTHPEGLPERYEIGTPNYPGIASLIAGTRFIQSVGVKKIMQKADYQTRNIIDALSSHPQITVYNKNPDLPIIAFNISGLNNDDVGYILARKDNIIVRTGLHCAPLVHKEIDDGMGCIRISLSWFTSDEECRIAIDAIREIANHANSTIQSS